MLDDSAAKSAGRAGEVRLVRYLLHNGCPVLHGLILPFSERSVTEIDVVALVGGTLLAFEVKAHAGVIHAPAVGDWTRRRRGAPDLRFHDPRAQHATHLRALAQNAPRTPVEGAILFTSAPRFEPIQPEGVYAWPQLDALLASVRARSAPCDRSRRVFLELARFHLDADRTLLEDAHRQTLTRARYTSWLQRLRISL